MQKISLIFIFTLFLCAIAFADTSPEESITITTYYPSPYGVYQQLRIYRSVKFERVNKDGTLPGGSSPQDGELIYNSSDKKFYFYEGDSGTWQPVGGDTGGIPLVNSQHTQSDCLDAGGQVVATDVGFKQCRFNALSCPSGWTQYKSYNSTAANECGMCHWGSGCPPCCTAGPQTWGNHPVAACSYQYQISGDSPDCRLPTAPQLCYATVIQVGCY